MRLVLSVWAATLFISFFIGWFSRGFVKPNTSESAEVASGSSKKSNNDYKPQDTERLAVQNHLDSTPDIADAGLVDPLDPGYFDPEIDPTIPRTVDPNSLFKDSDPLQRMADFVDALRTLNPNTIKPVLEAFESLPPDRSRANELKLLFHAWGKFAPEDAIEYAKTLGRSETIYATQAAVASWASYDATSAMEWAEQQEDENKRAEYLVGIVKGVAAFDKKAATEMLFTIEKTNYRYQAAALLVQDSLKQGIDSTIQWAESLPNSDDFVKRSIYTQVASAISKEDPKRAAEWALTMPEGDTRSSVISTVINYWSRESHKETASWVQQLPEGGSKYKAIEQMVNQWAWRDPASTAQWLNQFPSTTELDPAIEQFTNRISAKEPEVAADWANAILDTDKKDQALERVYKNWKKQDPDQAEIWARSNAPHLLPENNSPTPKPE